MREILRQFANISKNDVVGMRAPYLKPGRNTQYEVQWKYAVLSANTAQILCYGNKYHFIIVITINIFRPVAWSFWCNLSSLTVQTLEISDMTQDSTFVFVVYMSWYIVFTIWNTKQFRQHAKNLTVTLIFWGVFRNISAKWVSYGKNVPGLQG